MLTNILTVAILATSALAHGDHEHQVPIAGPHKALWYNTLPGDGGTQVGQLSPHIHKEYVLTVERPIRSSLVSRLSVACHIFRVWLRMKQRMILPFSVLRLTLELPTGQVRASGPQESVKVLAVSIYSSRRVGFSGGYNVPLATNPFNSWATVLDCGDIPVTSYDNTWALHQIEEGHNAILSRAPATDANKKGPAKNGKTLPRVITLGGDHTITLPLLRSINRAYGPISVIHFDSHLDTWKPKVFGGSPSKVASINHGTYFYHAAQEGLLANDSNIHAGIRTTLSGMSDYENDGYCGFEIVEAREIDTIGMDGIIKKIHERVGTTKPVYLSIDIDTLDPAFAPATGTPETGGWSTRELRTILRGLEGINLIAADIVEVAPAYDTNAEHTTMAAADALYEVMSLMVKKGPLSGMVKSEEVESIEKDEM
ncbi:putative agmatinase 1 [Lachnellula cervina]|uniref:Putative agmatinase 1 n=1 Tax=Lachnellula cervina TaxID=1316786 RepID=A0A7D8YSV9_9HELO|nr:putative agmatinase 1 [Lachnellula cervina]